MLRERKREAARIVAEAVAEVERGRREVEARLAADAEAVRERIRTESEREVAALRTEAVRRADRWRRADDATVDDLARFLLARVAAGTREDAP